jgi:capsular exopolysaccharide synthesis family protein
MGRIADALSKASGQGEQPQVSIAGNDPWHLAETPNESALAVVRPQPKEPVSKEGLPNDPWHLAETPNEPAIAVVRPQPKEPVSKEGLSLNEVPAAAAPAARRKERARLSDVAPAIRWESRSPDHRYDGKLVGDDALSFDSQEQFRSLAAAVRHSTPEGGKGVLLVTSALPGEGRTLVCSNVAETLSRSFGLRVLLIDGDLRHPSIHSAYGLPAAPGLVESLESDLSAPVPAFQLSRKLSVIVAGHPPRDPRTLVAGPAMQRLLQQASADYDWIVLDSPPMRVATDAAMLATLADRVLLVVKAGKTPYQAVREAVRGLGADRILGVALNQAEARTADPFREVPGASVV